MQSNKTVVLFLIKFFGTYGLLFLIYSNYLDRTQNTSNIFTCAPITNTVAKQTKLLMNTVGYTTEIKQHTEEVSIKLIVRDKYIARIIEGCNAISLIILFISFIVAFSSGFKTTLLFIVFGSLLIYVSNIIRIAIISIALFEFPQYQFLYHDILFPLMIYGIIVILWFIWVKKYSRIK